MRNLVVAAVIAAMVGVGPWSTIVRADQRVTCESRGDRYTECVIADHGYVTLSRQLSDTRCVQGRNWDYDRRRIWVDDGCRAEFRVETRNHTDGHPDHKGAEAVAAVAAIGIIAAAAAAAKHDDHDRYNDTNYGHGGHSSYMPGWVIGEFRGYNLRYGSNVEMRIGADGRADTLVNGARLRGYVNDGRLYIGNAEFYIERAGDGFNTIDINDTSNQVHYSRR